MLFGRLICLRVDRMRLHPQFHPLLVGVEHAIEADWLTPEARNIVRV